ncbi:hypothetical protein M409DRAFT_22853 [Zasmidium cellare ATCC 36951]|uniref:Zn(2)-C6 fungal-type domain-containing protein n=1 Tax=Zasmidium cellare ATCC 36951 TaxID=1080233 RepID=A0A6A6CM36_ZASCE|nr:uncharacterized protein M409DRAFT_22853 [Zasmidium cellare ATCC 36951]KAF2166799.1 hypothetical protein M409DRAFT_22853 [Zasmidium cellare ATCC 36951]
MTSGRKRTRNGCWTCRERKKKCDQGGPPCNNCTKLNLDCKTEVRVVWEDDSKRAAMKRRGPPSKARVSIKTSQSSDDNTKPFSPKTSDRVIHQRPSPYPRPLDSLDALLLENYVERFSRTYPTQSGPRNPFLSILLPIAMRSTVVFDSLLCLSSAGLWDSAHESMKVKRLALRQQALRGCALLLKAHQSGGVGDADPSALLASSTMFLCYEKIMGELNWRPHIQFINRFFERQGSGKHKSPIAHPDAFEFFRSFLVYNNLVQSTSSLRPTSCSFYAHADHIGTVEGYPSSVDRNDTSRRNYYPNLVARLAAGDASVTEFDIQQWDGSLSFLPSFALESATTSDQNQSGNDLAVVKDLYRLAATIYRLQGAAHHTSEPLGTDQTLSLEQLTAHAVLRMSLLPAGSSYENALLWPLAIVARALGSSQVIERTVVLHRLQYLEKRFGMRQFKRAQDVLVEHWIMQDAGQCSYAAPDHPVGTILLG